jgi:toxin FitB
MGAFRASPRGMTRLTMPTFISAFWSWVDPAQARALESWLSALIMSKSFAERVLPIDHAIADEWGRMSAKRSAPSVDALLAATAKVHRMTLATRNVSDVGDLGADVVNPFDPVI